MTALQQGLVQLRIDLSEQVQSQLLQFSEMLQRWNQVYNLTALHNPLDILVKHLLDCVAVLPYLHGRRILDVGTGAGLPGLVLAIAQPEWEFVLLDSQAKKLRFVTQVVLSLQLKNVQVVHQRLEQLNPHPDFNTVICRAYSSLSDFYQQSYVLCKPKGRLLAMKGIYPQAELENLPAGLLFEVVQLHIPFLEAQRHLVIISPHSEEILLSRHGETI